MGGVVGWVAHKILVTAQVLGFGIWIGLWTGTWPRACQYLLKQRILQLQETQPVQCQHTAQARCNIPPHCLTIRHLQSPGTGQIQTQI